MNADYMAGQNQKNVSKEAMINGSLLNQAELAGTWGYALIHADLNQHAFAHHSEVRS
jgi:hypothetical protein